MIPEHNPAIDLCGPMGEEETPPPFGFLSSPSKKSLPPSLPPSLSLPPHFQPVGLAYPLSFFLSFFLSFIFLVLSCSFAFAPCPWGAPRFAPRLP